MSWVITELSQGYKRSIVGFDVRVADRMLASSMDPCVWPQHESMEFFDVSRYSNGLNLAVTFEALSGFSGFNGAVLVGFDIPKSLALMIERTFGLRSSDINIFSSSDWKFLGYDVVDIRTQLSAIWWGGVNIRSGETNEYGLVNGQDEAIKISISADRIFVEHAPFCPCGVWMKIG